MAADAALELAVVVPTYNEADNIAVLIDRLHASLTGRSYEIIVVDDHSGDGTAGIVRDIARQDRRVRCIERVGRRGLSSAVIEGMMASAAPLIAVIDGDGQHDETRLPSMLDAMADETVQLVVGSRYAEGGGFGDWAAHRRRMSEFATWLAKKLTGATLTDPMSGFFMVRSDSLRDRVGDLTGVGYKILLDVLSAPGPGLKVAEVPFEFRTREKGESKLDNKVLLEFVELLIARTLGRYVPTKFVMFGMVGGLGVIVHMVVLALLYQNGVGPVGFAMAQATATVVAMTANFFVNNFFTYFDRQLKGWQLLPGWLSFAAASSVGAVANLGIAVYLFETWDAVWFVSGIAGIIVGAAWNYAVTALYTWKT
jgi:dolichol-phosphate mannosyltransferase